jgi:hypothetical protein
MLVCIVIREIRTELPTSSVSAATYVRPDHYVLYRVVLNVMTSTPLFGGRETEKENTENLLIR